MAVIAAITTVVARIPRSCEGTLRPRIAVSRPNVRTASSSSGLNSVRAVIGVLLEPITRRLTE